MVPAVPPYPSHADWKALYRAAILETNKNAIPQKVSAAEQAVSARARELFYKGGPREERNALDHALHVLRAYKVAREQADAA